MDCETPPSITNGSPGVPTTTTFTGTVTYSCVTGYWISPRVTTATATCKADRTWVPLPTCQCTWISTILVHWHIIFTHSVVDCGSLPTIMNASPGTPTRTTYLGTVTYTCVSGYEVSNGVTTAMAICQDNGNWRPLPTCTSMVQGFFIFRIVHHTELRTYSCELWWSSHYSQWISWYTIQLNIWRDSVLHM